MSNIKIVRLVSGEEILGELKRSTSIGAFTIHSPAIIIPSERGQISLAPWMPYGQMEGVEIQYDKTVFVVDPQDSLRDHYIEVTSGIVTKIAK